jgi:hypothetical protein
MPYLPPGLIEDQPFPQSWGRDVQLQIRIINEKYRRNYPEADYFMLKKATTKADAAMDPVGEAGTTKWDPLYGESVDPSLTTWKQPHGTDGVVKTVGVDQFNPPIRIPRRFQKITRDEDLHKYGFDLKRTATVFFPVAMLDDFGITVQAGDKLAWNNEHFAVLQWAPTGWWRATNIYFYLALSVEHLRLGA